MIEELQKTLWRVSGCSTRGNSHLQTGLPNQDALGTWVSDDGSVAALFVSDGHGSARHFRSDTGSRTAVNVAAAVLKGTALPVSREHAKELSAAIVRNWREAVLEHLAANPFTPEEWTKVPDKEMEQAKASIEANPAVAYGATLLAVLASPTEVVFMQLGDGDILCVAANGVTTRPMAGDARLIANQTTSLCQLEAAAEFRMSRINAETKPLPALILVSSDGYSNSFQSEEDFLQVGTDYLGLLKSHGMEKVQGQLENILSEASRKGSGDDITLGLLERVLPANYQEVPVAKSEPAKPEPAKSVAKPDPKPASEKLPLDTPVVAQAKPRDMSTQSRLDASTRRTKLLWTRVALVGMPVVAVAVSLAVWQPPFISTWLATVWPSRIHKPVVSATKPSTTHAVTPPPREVAGAALLLGNGSKLALKSGLLIDADALHLGKPFAGPIFEVLEAPAHTEGFVLSNRSPIAWHAIYPGESASRKIGPHESVPAERGAKLIFGKVTVEVVSI